MDRYRGSCKLRSNRDSIRHNMPGNTHLYASVLGDPNRHGRDHHHGIRHGIRHHGIRRLYVLQFVQQLEESNALSYSLSHLLLEYIVTIKTKRLHDALLVF